MQEKCRVRKLKIQTDERSLLPRINFLLEDALRTASFPGIPANGVVYIKSMNLGCFDSKISSRFISEKIDSFIRNLRPVRAEKKAIHQKDIPAVWFADELEPYLFLIDLLTRNQSPKAWYWPVAVKGWSPQSPVSQSLQEIIYRVAQKSTGLSGLAHVLEPLLNDDKILDLFHSMEQRKVLRLMSYLGLTTTLSLKEAIQKPIEKEAIEESFHPFNIMEGRYQELVKKALIRWKIKDARLNLIICLGLADSRQDVKPSQVVKIIKKAVKVLSIPSQSALKSTQLQKQETKIKKPSSKQASPHSDLPEKQRHPPLVQQTEHSDSLQKMEPSNEIDLKKKKTFEPKLEGKDKEQTQLSAVELGHVAYNYIEGKYDIEQIESIERVEKETNPEIQFKTKDDGVIKEPASSENLFQNEKSHWPEEMHLFYPFSGELSNYAGFSFLITVLDKLGFENILSDHDEFPIYIFAQRVLWRIAVWQNIPEDNPVLKFLKKESDLISPSYKCKKPLNRQTILDGAKACNRNMFQIPKSLDPLKSLNMDQLIHVFVIAICRYIHHHAKITIQKLIKRSAYIAFTKTHMDITTSIKNLDIRIRLAGLDINPGWVPWLGRVIQFHYTEEEY